VGAELSHTSHLTPQHFDRSFVACQLSLCSSPSEPRGHQPAAHTIYTLLHPTGINLNPRHSATRNHRSPCPQKGLRRRRLLRRRRPVTAVRGRAPGYDDPAAATATATALQGRSCSEIFRRRFSRRQCRQRERRRIRRRSRVVVDTATVTTTTCTGSCAKRLISRLTLLSPSRSSTTQRRREEEEEKDAKKKQKVKKNTTTRGRSYRPRSTKGRGKCKACGGDALSQSHAHATIARRASTY